MSWQRFAVVLSLLWAGSGMAQTHTRPHPWIWPWTNAGKTCPPIGCCPDDYCRKPCPVIVPVPRCGGPDDYCRKPMPCITDIPRCGTCDDYCRKPLPCLLCPPLTPYLKCGSPNECNSVFHRR